ncbi:MAG: hypothetical protein ACE15F_14800 [bacterium]
MKSFCRMGLIFILTISAVPAGYPAKIAMLVPTDLFLMGEDPVNIPEDKVFLLETMSTAQAGLYWLVRHWENDLGHVVNIYNSDQDDPVDVQDTNDLIFITEALGSGSVAADYRTSVKPVIFAEAYIMDDMGLTNGQSAFTGDSAATEIQIVNPNHPITKGLPDTFTATILDKTTGKPILPTFSTVTDTSVLGGVGEILAVLPTSIDISNSGSQNSENVPVVIAVEKGTTLDQGDETLARWVFLGYSDDIEATFADYGGDPNTKTLAVLSEPAIKLLDNCTAWALGMTTRVDSWPVH